MFCVLLIIYALSLNRVQPHQILDLTWPLNNSTIFWPGIQSFQVTKTVEDSTRGHFYAMKEFCMGEHGGTHLDAPYHFNANGWRTAQIPLERLIAKGALIDLSVFNAAPRNLTVDDLERHVATNGVFEANTVLLVKFGWAQFWPDRERYYRLRAGVATFPGVGAAAGEWIAANGGIVGVGVDTASVDAAGETSVHRVLYGKQIYGLENVKLVESLPARNFTLLVMPIKIEEGTGAPARIMALV